jgi:Family of unknown function (DUF5317)
VDSRRLPGQDYEAERSLPLFPILVVVVLAFAVGLLLRGSPREFAHLHVHWWVLVFLGLGLQTLAPPRIGDLPADALAAAMLAGSYVLLLVFLAANRWIPAAGVMAIGLLLNLTVVGINGGMPVSADAIRSAGGSVDQLAQASGEKHHLMSDNDLLPFLGDVIPVPEPIGAVLSVGDVLLYGGVAWFIVQVMRGRSRANPRPLAVWFPSYRGKHAPPYWRMPARYRGPGRAEAVPPGIAP